MESLFNVAVFVLFLVGWAAFAAALAWNRARLDQVWAWIQGLPLIAQGVVWLLFLPLVAGLWVWDSAWPVVVRLVGVAGLGFFNLYVFLPRELLRGRV